MNRMVHIRRPHHKFFGLDQLETAGTTTTRARITTGTNT